VNAIFVDFLSHLENLDSIVRSYVSLPISIWTKQWEPWKGFYEQLTREKKGLDWGYVNTIRRFSWCMVARLRMGRLQSVPTN
jgi:hypothetical protein